MLIAWRTVGGLRFLRVGRVQVSWCVTRSAEVRQPAAWLTPAQWVRETWDDALYEGVLVVYRHAPTWLADRWFPVV